MMLSPPYFTGGRGYQLSTRALQEQAGMDNGWIHIHTKNWKHVSFSLDFLITLYKIPINDVKKKVKEVWILLQRTVSNELFPIWVRQEAPREKSLVYSKVLKIRTFTPPVSTPITTKLYASPCLALALSGSSKIHSLPPASKKKSLLCLSFDACPHLQRHAFVPYAELYALHILSSSIGGFL